MKTRSVFAPSHLAERARANAARYPWAAEMREAVLCQAEPFLRFSDDELWEMMFGCTISRSWMVWSNGYCPACKGDVPMYNWQIDALKHPWKVRCPHCRQFFPTNDFYAFYRSGLDEHGVFDPARADRALLYNLEHPSPADPLYRFGVDDGEGYVEGERRWRFIGAYLVYGQWKQLVLGGIKSLAAAYVLTGEREYAHRAGVLLDRVADLYPTFDFGTQGLVYEGRGRAGYVSTWHDACEETRELALAYDQVFEALRDDERLVSFLARKAQAFKLDNPKATFADIQHNIEERILRDALAHRYKIESNYPRTDIAILIIQMILGWPANRAEVMAHLDAVLDKVTAVDGVTGEKGLAGYSAYVIQGLAQFLALCNRMEPSFLADLLQRHPRLAQTYRFHLDTWCLGQYYPSCGDSGAFAEKCEQYVGVRFDPQPGVEPSGYTFLWDLYRLTGDVGYVQALYRANGNRVEGLPHDLFVEEPTAIQQGVAEVIAREGTTLKVGSVNKQEWHLAILRSGQGEAERALWLDYDTGGRHSHADGMNLGLYALGLDLLPDFGYPPVQYGGWESPRARWYTMTAAHNTVVVDGLDQRPGAGKTTLWLQGEGYQAVCVSGPELIGGLQYERTVALVDLSPRDFYVLDIFRVVGGMDHAKFLHSHFGRIRTQGLTLRPAEDYGYGTQMRAFAVDPDPPIGWGVEWEIEDRHGYLPPGAPVHLRYIDLTYGAQAYTCEGWVSVGGFTGNREAWIPRIMVRRRGEAPLATTFVGIIEPYEHSSRIAAVRRLPLEAPSGEAYPDSYVALEVRLVDGRRDLIVCADVENPLGLRPSFAESGVMVQQEWGRNVCQPFELFSERPPHGK